MVLEDVSKTEANENVVDMLLEDDTQPDTETVSFHVNLPNIIGLGPLLVNFDGNCTVQQMMDTLEQQLKLGGCLELESPIPFDSIPPYFAVKVGHTDRFDFDKKCFTISKDTRFVQYWNDFLDAANKLEEQKSTEPSEGEVQYDGKLKAHLDRLGTTLHIGDARIQFLRTLRIPDDDKTCTNSASVLFCGALSVY